MANELQIQILKKASEKKLTILSEEKLRLEKDKEKEGGEALGGPVRGSSAGVAFGQRDEFINPA